MRQAQRRAGSRIIPADAGSTLPRTPTRWAKWDHPRRCGEHVIGVMVWDGSKGSSPQMRGALTLGQQGCFEHGIIPADAGSTRTSNASGRSIQDHPRRCGEHFGCGP